MKPAITLVWPQPLCQVNGIIIDRITQLRHVGFEELARVRTGLSEIGLGPCLVWFELSFRAR